MFDTATLTISGNVVAEPYITGDANRPDRVTFRVISNRRRKDRESGEWVPAGEYGMNVVCWRKLARGVAQAIHKGDPVLVTGRISERRYQNDDGENRWRTEVTADFVGHDLAQGYAGKFTRFTKIDRPGEAHASAPASGSGGDATSLGQDNDGHDDPAGSVDEFDAGQVNEVFGEPAEAPADSEAVADAETVADAEVAEPVAVP